jgi:hypothetical protein
MSEWEAQIASVVQAGREEIEADLALALKLRGRAAADLEQAEERVRKFELLLALGNEAGAPAGPPAERVTLHKAMRIVLSTAPGGRMLAAELAAHIDRRGLYKMRDGRSVEAQQIHARVGHYPDLFTRDGSSYIGLKGH